MRSVVDGRGNIYVNGRLDFEPGEGNASKSSRWSPPLGLYAEWPMGSRSPRTWPWRPTARRWSSRSFAGRLTAFDIADDGGLSHRRVWADGVGPDGTCADAKGAIWTGVGGFGDNPVGRVREGGEVLEQVHVCLPLLRLHARRRGRQDAGHAGSGLAHIGPFADNNTRLTEGPRTGQRLTAPGAGWP
jgi:SMP-30/Gluconolactonase/LRE-like region